MIDSSYRSPPGSWLHGPFVPLSLAFGLGIFTADYLAIPPLLQHLILAAGLLPLAAGLLQPARPVARLSLPLCKLELKTALLLLLPLFFLAGFHLALPQLQPPAAENHLYRLLATEEQEPASSQDVVLGGVLHELPRPSPGGRTRLILAVDELHRPAAHLVARGLIQLTVNGRLSGDIRPGDRLLIRALVGPVRSFTVPGAFDYRQFLARQGIWLSGWVANPLQVAKVQEPSENSSGLGNIAAYLPEKLRAKASETLNRHLVEQEARPVLRALIIGDRSEIPPEWLETFKAAGAMHLLAISGMHLGLIALLSTLGAEWLLKRSPQLLLLIPARKGALLLALLPIIAYALITGLQPPAQRALLMTLVFIGAVLRQRQWCSLNNLGLAALLILALDPPALFGASFQLSFAATAGIILLTPTLEQGYRHNATLPAKIGFWILASLLVSLVATVVTAPLAMHHFHRVSLLSPLTTLLATPLIFFCSLPAALLALLCSASGLPGAEPLATLLFALAAKGIDITVWLTTKLAALPGSFFYLAPPTPAEFMVWGLLFSLLPGFRRGSRLPNINLRLAVVSLATLLLFLLPVWRQWQRSQDQQSRISFLDVGHGNATVIEMPGNRNFVVDGGGPPTLSTDVGEQLIAPFLRRRGIKRLEGIVISHPHADHYNGIPFVIRNFRPEFLWISGHGENIGEYRALLELARQAGVEIKVPETGEVLAATAATPDLTGPANQFAPVSKLKNLTDFHFQLPDQWPFTSDPINDQGLVISYRHGNHSFLLPGDIGMDQERSLLAQTGPSEHQVLAASHHGRWSSMAPEFVTATNPYYIIVSDDQRRVDPQRIVAWQKHGATVLTTGSHGTILCLTNGFNLECRTTRAKHQ